ncbi:helix-turn-helix domain-containing protein [Lyngbya aestuarii]|uniref:helix-turn-helix domain-containing protein n=1 Tax=Lyngbya aestuarii TaxID=118322 RepID=UPI00403E05C5
MSKSPPANYTQLLQQLMQQVSISSFQQLSSTAGVSKQQIMRLRQGKVSQMRVSTLLKLSEILQVSLSQLLKMFSPDFIATNYSLQEEESSALTSLQQEYQRLQQQLEKQRETLRQEFQLSSLQALESWLVQWPTAAYAAQQNEQLPAVRLLALMRPVHQLLQEWGVNAIASVGSEIPFDPQEHQLLEGTAQVGDMVRVRYAGYRLREKLLYRVQVSPINNTRQV